MGLVSYYRAYQSRINDTNSAENLSLGGIGGGCRTISFKSSKKEDLSSDIHVNKITIRKYDTLI
jgi:hypothetical protein